MNVKKLLGIIVSVMAAFVLMLQVAKYTRPTETANAKPVITSQAGLTTEQRAFIELCSGLTVNNDTAAVAVSYCLGNVRGFADAHTLTVRLASNTDSSVRDGLILWCVDRQVSDKQLLDGVIKWSSENATRVQEIASKYSDRPSSRTAVLIAALHGAFPCRR